MLSVYSAAHEPQYVNIDAGYLLQTRDSGGGLQVDPAKFPHGMRATADYLHSHGLKLGLYTDVGNHACGNGGPGSLGHYAQDAHRIAIEWDADYLKADHCGSTPGFDDEYSAWAALRDALNGTGKAVYYSTCPVTTGPRTGTAQPYAGVGIYSPPLNWSVADVQALANSVLVEYRNNVDAWYSATAANCTDAGAPCGMITNIDATLEMTRGREGLASAPGTHWDMDMLQVCNGGHLNGGMTPDENAASFSVWSVMGSPLILSADIRNIERDHPACLQMLLNPEVLAIDQDTGGHAPQVLSQTATPGGSINVTTQIAQQVVARRMADGSHAVVLLNRGAAAAPMQVTWPQLGLQPSVSAIVRDVLARKELGSVTGAFKATVRSHAAVFVRITPSQLGQRHPDRGVTR